MTEQTKNREFTLKEKILLIILTGILLGVAYYYLVDVPVRAELERCANEKANLEIDLGLVNRKLQTLRDMKEELEAIEASGDVSMMSSYNGSKEEIRLLNDVLSQTKDYSISFASVSRNGDQIRRNFSLQFVAEDYNTMSNILAGLAKSPYRCLVADVQCSRNNRYYAYDYTDYTVSLTATFFETMVGGEPDAGLPADKK